jgi:hypothetical protein
MSLTLHFVGPVDPKVSFDAGGSVFRPRLEAASSRTLSVVSPPLKSLKLTLSTSASALDRISVLSPGEILEQTSGRSEQFADRAVEVKSNS